MEDGACNKVFSRSFIAVDIGRDCLNATLPFLSSIVTVSFAHFMRNLAGGQRSGEGRALKLELSLEVYLCRGLGREAYLTSFILVCFPPDRALKAIVRGSLQDCCRYLVLSLAMSVSKVLALN